MTGVALTAGQREQLRRRREELALAQDEFASVSSATVRSVENAYADRYSVAKLAALMLELGFSVGEVHAMGLVPVANRMRRMQKGHLYVDEVERAFSSRRHPS